MTAAPDLDVERLDTDGLAVRYTQETQVRRERSKVDAVVHGAGTHVVVVTGRDHDGHLGPGDLRRREAQRLLLHACVVEEVARDEHHVDLMAEAGVDHATEALLDGSAALRAAVRVVGAEVYVRGVQQPQRGARASAPYTVHAVRARSHQRTVIRAALLGSPGSSEAARPAREPRVATGRCALAERSRGRQSGRGAAPSCRGRGSSRHRRRWSRSPL